MSTQCSTTELHAHGGVGQERGGGGSASGKLSRAAILLDSSPPSHMLRREKGTPNTMLPSPTPSDQPIARLPFYRQLYVQVLIAIAAGVASGRFFHATGAAAQDRRRVVQDKRGSMGRSRGLPVQSETK